MAFAGAFGLILLRLFYLQVVQGGDLAAESESNRTQVIFLRAPRGDFYDRKDRVLVMNRPSWALMYSVPEANKVPRREVEERLRPFLEPFPKYWTRRLEVAYQTKKMVRLVEDVPDQIAFVMREMGEMLPGMRVLMEFRRGYPMGVFAVHLVGYLGEVSERELHDENSMRKAGDLVGKMGLEKSYDEKLRGVDGGMLIEVDSIGKLKRIIKELPFRKGNSIRLTLDYDVQRAAEEELAKTAFRRGAAVALDVRTGAVLAWASAPSFDPLGNLAEGLVDENRPFFDRVYRGAYPPGSVFKIVTAAAGFERNAINVNERVECTGAVYLADKTGKERRYKCWKRHGWVDYWKGMAESCDTYYYLLGKKIGPQAIHDTARKFGFGQMVQNNFSGEVAGNIPDPAWKRKMGYGGWSTGDTFNMSIGQGFVTSTPLQCAVLLAGVAADGLVYRPYVVDRILDTAGQTIFSSTPQLLQTVALRKPTWDTIHESLRTVVTQGTGVGINLPYLDIRGKTGTAQNPHGDDHAWFSAYGGYPGEPAQYVVCVFVENGGHGGAVAVPIARRMFQLLLPPRPADGGPRQSEGAV